MLNEKCKKIISEILEFDLLDMAVDITVGYQDVITEEGKIKISDYISFKDRDTSSLYITNDKDTICFSESGFDYFKVSKEDAEIIEKVEKTEIKLDLALTESISGIVIDNRKPDYLDSLIKEKAKLISHFDKDFDPSILDDCFIENDYFFDDDDFEDYDEGFNLEKFQEKYSDDYIDDDLLDEDENVEIFLEKFSDKLDSMIRDVAQEMEEKNKEKLD